MSKSVDHSRNSGQVSRLLSGSSLAALMLLAVASPAQAQEDRNWDANGTAVGTGGTGTWNLNNLNWSPSADGVSGPYTAPWDNVALDNAIFGGTAGTVTLGSPITVQNLTFNTAGYALTGGTLTLGGVSPTINTNTASGGVTTIGSVIAGTAGLIKAGGGRLQLSGVNTFSGDISILGGRLYASSDAALGAASNSISTAAGQSVWLGIEGSGTSRSVTIGDGGTLVLTGAGVGSALISGNGSVDVAAANDSATIVRLTNDNNSYTGSTTFNGCNGVCTVVFSSVGNIGEASSLGAASAANSTITFNQSSQYSDNVIYIGDGDSSNRNWDINGSAGLIRNQGTGTLSITGDIDISGGGTFSAETADIELLGVLSGGDFGFSSLAGHSVTVGGGANTFSGQANINGLVRTSVLADVGAVSSLGAGANIALNAGTLSYTGTGATSNRLWSVSGATGILNDGTGALNLSGGATFTPDNPVDSLTLGGSYAGVNTYSGIITGTGNLIGNGSGTWVLSGANDFVGTVTVSAGTLQAGSASAFGAATGFIVNGGTLDLGGYDLTAPSLTGTGGTVALGASTLTVSALTAQSYAGNITGSGGLRKIGAGSLTLTGESSYTGATTIAGGKLALDFSGAGSPAANILSASSPLVLSGGTLEVLGAAGATNNQTFNGLTVNAGSNTVRAINGAGGIVNLNLGAISRAGGLVNFVLPGGGAIITTNADGVLGGWATINGSDYAKVIGGTILAFEESDYINKDNAGDWVTGDIVSDTANAANTPFEGTVNGNVQLGGLRYTAAADSTVTIGAGNTLGVDGTIIVAPSTLATNQRLTGGSVTGGAGGGTLGVQQNGSGTFTIASTIIDNGGTSFAKSGGGTARLTGANSYAGGTTLSGGRLEITSLANGGVNSSIGASSADSSNLVLESGTLAYRGGSDAVSDRGFTLVNGGSERAIDVEADRSVEFSGLVTSPDDAGLTKTGWGTLVLSNAANDYVGVTTVTGGGTNAFSTLSVNTLANGGVASGMGAASSNSANLVLSDGGRLQYTGGTVEIDRGFTLAGGSGRIGVTQAATTLTIGGTAVGTGRFVKDGAGTLILSGTNSYTGGTAVTAGTLVAGSVRAFGGGEGGVGVGSLTVDAGATVDLANNSVFVGGLHGEGSVLLGTATLNINAGGSFAGTISGTGGISVTRFTQTMTGCNNSYTGVTSIITTLRVDCLADGGQASGIGGASSDPANLVINGTLSYFGGSVIIDRGFTSGGGQIVVEGAAATLEFTGATTGAGFIKEGAGTLVLSGVSTRNGTTQIDAGTLRAGAVNAFGSGRINFNNPAAATVDLAGYNTTVAYLSGGTTAGSNVTLGGATLTLAGGNGDFAGAISGPGALTKTGSGTQTLSGCDSSYDGITTVSSGVLAVACLADGGLESSIGGSSSAAGNLVLNGGTLRYTGTGGSTDRQFTLGASTSSALDASGSGAIVFTNTGAIAFVSPDTAQTIALTGTSVADNRLGAQITDNGAGVTSLRKTGTGTWILTNSGSTYTGVTNISGGVLGVDKLADGGVASSIGASSSLASNLVIGSGSTLRYTGAGDTTNRLFTLAAGTSFIESSGTGAIIFTDTGPVTLAGINQARTIALGGTNTGNNTLAGAIGDAGTGVTTLAKNDSGNWVLTGNNTFTGNTVINDGNLIIGNGGTTGNVGTGNVFVTSATSTLSFNRSDTFNFTGAISGPGGIAQIGTGTTVLTATNSIGAARVDDGTLRVDGALGTATLAMNGNGALIVNGTVEGATAGSASTFTGDAGASMITVNAGGTLRASGDLGDGNDTFTLAGTLATGGAALNLGDGNDVFTLNDGGVITGSGVDAGAGTDGLIVDNAVARTLDGASIAAFESLTKQSGGMLTLTGDHDYSDGTTIAAGTLRVGNGGASGTLAGDIANNGALELDRSGTLTIAGAISGAGSVDQLGSGTTILTANNSYSGGTTISAGALQLGDGGTSGFITGDVANDGSFIFNRSDSVGFDGLVSGAGSLAQNGSGVVTLTADNSYGGATTVNAGTLLINGDQSAATGLTSVASGATLGGIGTIGGDVSVANGGILTAGSNGVGTLSIAGGLTLNSGSVLNMEFGQADTVGGALNDLVEVGGDLTLDGATLNVSVPTGGTFGPGIYRVFNYDGDLLNDDLALGAMPGGSDVSVQTAVSGQVNLVNSAGLSLSFWDGDGGPKFNDTINGGNGTWHLGGTDNNWTGSDGAINAAYADGTFAIFAGTGGTVTVDNGPGPVTASGMQFASDGYLITGDALTLTGPQSLIQVGDSSVAGAGFTATIGAALTGMTQLVKTDAGTLVLSGTNNYTGGTRIEGGTVRISSDANLGNAAGGLDLDGGTLNTTSNIASTRDVTLAGAGTLLTDAGTTFALSGAIAGAGALTKDGAGALVLTGDAAHGGGTTIAAGTLQIGNGGTAGSLAGNVLNNGTLTFDRSDDTSFAGAITGTGNLVQTGGGVLRLTGASDYSGTTLIEGSELRLENGGSINSGQTRLAGPDATLTVTGAGSSLTTTELRLGFSTGGAVTLNIADGGEVIATGTAQVSLGGAVIPGAPAHDITVNVSGTGSLWDVGGNVTVGFTSATSARVNVTNGATVRSGGLVLGPSLLSMTNPSDVTISGAGSTWTTGGLTVARGTLSLLDGGRLDAATGTISAATISQNGQGTVLISGAGSELAITGALGISGSGREAIVTVSDGGQLSAGGLLTLAGLAAGSGTLNIGAAAGDTAAAAGTVQAANIAFGPGTGTINFNHTDTAYDFGAAMSGAGAINQLAGVTLLSGDSAAFSGTTSVSGGALYVNNALGGNVAVATGGALGGIGTIGGNVTVADGALNPGDLGTAPGTLTINGNLDLAAASTINVSLGQANVVGGALNDLIEVGGDLTLDGTLNVETAAGGSFDPGVYRVINYGGALTDNGLAIGTIPSPDFYVQTSVDKQVNLVNTAGLQFRYWDGIGTKNDGVIDGGDGLWQRSTGNDNWVDDGNIPNAQFADAAFAVFMGATGTVTVDRSLGDVEASGMQFLTDGYVIEGESITLAGTRAVIRVGDGTAAGAGTSATIASELTGAAELVKSDLGTLVLTGNNSYTGGTAIEGGTLAVSTDANLGDAAGGLTFNGGTLNTTADLASSRDVEFLGAGTLLTDDATTLTLGGTLSGAGALTKQGLGTLILSGSGGHSGGTAVSAGTLFVNGDLSGATGLMTIANGATLGGTGTIGGDVSFADGATLAPGAGGTGTLTIVGDLGLAAGTTLDYQFGQANTAGGALNDLVDVGGDLVLDGTINVSVPAGGDFGGGIYRVFNYGGSLTDNGLVLGAMPAGSDVSVQTAVAGQVNLVNTAGLTLSFWDGNTGPKNNDSINGGDGVWRLAGGGNNWTDEGGAVNADYAQDTFAVFAGTPGTVTIDDIGGAVRASGMQFAVDGYSLIGDALTLTGAQATIRVGDGTAAGAGYTATIDTELGGSAQLVKTDAGTLVLSGTNSYTGGTLVSGGTLSISSDANLGAAAGGLVIDGATLATSADITSGRAIDLVGDATFATDAGTSLTLTGIVSGAGALDKDDEGTLILTAASVYDGGTTITNGTLQLGDGGTSGSILGDVANEGELAFDRLDSTIFSGLVSGSGSVSQIGSGTTILTAANSYTGGTTISAGTLQLGNGGTSGSITGDVVNDGTLVFHRADDVTFAGLISGSGDVRHAGSGMTILTGSNAYAGDTLVAAGTLLVNGDQSAATGLTTVDLGATLGGIGTIGGDANVAGTLAPGEGAGPGALTINGNLNLASTAGLAYQFGQANAPGSPLNDVVNVGGDLLLDGTLNVGVSPGGSFDIGLYRVINYGGALTDNGLVLGTLPAGIDSDALSVQTSIAGQVNLINANGVTLNFWDGAAGPKFDNVVNGGDGIWQNSGGNDNWTDPSGAVNAPFTDSAIAIFSAAAGTVSVDDSLGTVSAGGMQFASDGYLVTGDAVTLANPQSVIRVGDGTAGGAAYTATIASELTGNAQLVKTDLGTLVLSGTNSYTDGTLVNGGTLSISSDANLGAAAGGLAFNGGTLNTTADIVSSRAVELAGAGTITTDAGTTLDLGGAISGPGALTKAGAGMLILGGSGSYTGGTNVSSGVLLVNGDYSAATGATAIATGATLGGTGTIGGDVTLADGATLTPGAGGAGTLTIGGNLGLSNGTQLAYEFGEADSVGGGLNDLVNVGGDLVLDGTLNVAVTAGGAFDVGVYRVFNYGGALTNNGLSLGTMPAGSEVAVQTSISGQVNLVNSAGLTLNFWDGAAGPKNDGVINGGNGIWQNSAGNDNWTEVTGEVNAPYSDDAFAIFGGTGGTVTLDDSLGAISAAGMQFGVDGYTITGDAIALTGPEAIIRVGDGSTAGTGYTATIDSVLTGATGLVKTDAGTLVLGGANTYNGGTRIVGGTVQVSADTNLGAATGAVTLEGGTLATTASFASARDIVMTGPGTISTAADTTFTFDGLFSGPGALTKAGTGTLLVTGDSSAYAGAATVAAGTLAVQGSLGSAVTVADGARLEGAGQIGSLINSGTVAPGRDGFGTLTVLGGYAGAGGTLEIETALGGDASQTDRLVVGGGTSGTTEIVVTNRGGLGGQTVEGIKIIDVTGGTSSGVFNLRGDYVFEGSAAVIAGAYGYRLYQGGVSTPTDGDWYLRSALLDGSGEPEGPLYQPGVPLYENYGQVLQSLNNLPTLQERVGNRSWAASADGKATGIWGRMESTRARPDARVSTAGTDANIDSWKLQMGADRTLSDSENGTLIAGITGHYGESNASVRSTFGDGSIKAKAYGAGATLTWYHRDGFYADAQAQFAWFDGRLTSSVLGTLVDGNDGTGKAFSLEMGKRAVVAGGLTVTPQVQMIYQDADFDSFADPSDAQISSGKGDSLKTRWGISLDHQKEWESSGTTRRSHLYGLVNLSYEWLDGTEANVSGTAIRNSNDRLWGEIALGGSLGLNDRVTIYSQASASSPFRDFGNDYSIKGVAGVRVAF